jgi:cell division protein FtsW (lipid II flippase)
MTDTTTSLSPAPERTSRPAGQPLWTERILLLLAAAFIFINTLALTYLHPSGALTDWGHLAVWLLCAAGGTYWLDSYLPRRDPLLFPLAMFLSGWGLVLIDRLAPNFANRQTVWLPVATAAMLAVATFPHALRLLRTYRYTLLVLGLVLLVSTIFLGRNPSGQPGAPELWLGYGTLYFQPSEPLKVMLVAFLASYLAEQSPAMRVLAERRRWALSPRIIGPILLMWGLSVLILIWQRDLGTAILFFIVFVVLLYVASGSTFILISGAALTIIAGAAAYFLFSEIERRTGVFVNPFVRRVDIWINPWADPDGRAFQVVQSLMAFAAGGMFGQGIGQGAPTYIPVVHSDFIFAAVGEEWGLLGVLAVITCIAVLVMRGLRVAIAQRGHPFHTLLAVGLSSLLAVQSLMIMGGVLKLIPLTGVTLPYMSYGGSSLLTNFVMIGLLLRLSSEDHT